MPSRPADRRGLLRAAAGMGLLLLGPQRVSALAPAGPPALLTLSGRITQPDRGREAVFDRARLEALPQASFSTRTPW
ncbi:MAG: hypothetical protein KGK09_13790, partial [Burkholderiales bacterium]|nr:hypothetical protein [Burkholderiales bacterium]